MLISALKIFNRIPESGIGVPDSGIGIPDFGILSLVKARWN